MFRKKVLVGLTLLVFITSLFFLKDSDIARGQMEDLSTMMEDSKKMEEEFKKEWEEERKSFKKAREEMMEMDIHEEKSRIQREWEEMRWEIKRTWAQEKQKIREMAARERGEFLKVYKDEDTAIKENWKPAESTSVKQRDYEVTSGTCKDYEESELSSTGVAIAESPEKIEEAKAKALKIALMKLSDTVLTIKPTNKESIGELVKQPDSPVKEEDVDCFVTENAKIEPEEKVKELPDGRKAVYVEVSTPMHGNTQTIQDIVKPILDKEKKVEEYEVEKEAKASATVQVEQKGPFTGLIIDTRGANVIPCIAPEVLADAGGKVYGPGVAYEEYVEKTGIVGWTRTIKPARPHIRAGGKPLIIKSKDLVEANKMIVRNDDANVIITADGKYYFLKKGRVVVVVD
ncbi:MAG: hypothetical protein JSU92_14085 [Deltaproteobacteria bacterium]|nr:MAG: hypothetical protein JSU92_14085 [Deltaproteobacteria bacterium]